MGPCNQTQSIKNSLNVFSPETASCIWARFTQKKRLKEAKLLGLSADNIDAERKRHDSAMEKLQAAQIEWTHKRQQRIDFINNQLRLERKAETKIYRVKRSNERIS